MITLNLNQQVLVNIQVRNSTGQVIKNIPIPATVNKFFTHKLYGKVVEVLFSSNKTRLIIEQDIPESLVIAGLVQVEETTMSFGE